MTPDVSRSLVRAIRGRPDPTGEPRRVGEESLELRVALALEDAWVIADVFSRMSAGRAEEGW